LHAANIRYNKNQQEILTLETEDIYSKI